MEYEYIGLGYHSEVGGASAVYQKQQEKEDSTLTSTSTHRSRNIPVAATSKTGGGFVRPAIPEEPPPLPPPPPPPALPTSDTDYGKQQHHQQQEQQQQPQSPLRKLPPSQLNPQQLSVIHQRREQLAQQNTAAQDGDDDETRDKIAAAAAAAAAAGPTTTAATTAATGSDSGNNNNEMIEAARLRAMEVISKFQQQQDESNLGDGELGRKRKEFLDTFQKERLRLAMIKNLEYVARVEDERLQAKLVLQEQAHHYHIQLEDYHNQVLLSRQQQQQQQQQQQNLNTSQAGIGTQQRNTQEKKKRKQEQHIPNNQESVAIYVSNLPTDGSASDELMRALFGSYGSLRKIHFYYDKQTGNLKGDALVIYNLDSNNNTNYSSDDDAADGGGGASASQNRDSKSELIDTVCCQMNGAELPCGTALKVEPSDPLYAIRKKQQQAIQYGQVPADAMETVEAEMKKPAIKSGDDRRHGQNKEGMSQSRGENEPVANNDNDDDDDLDDFFASL